MQQCRKSSPFFFLLLSLAFLSDFERSKFFAFNSSITDQKEANTCINIIKPNMDVMQCNIMVSCLLETMHGIHQNVLQNPFKSVCF